MASRTRLIILVALLVAGGATGLLLGRGSNEIDAAFPSAGATPTAPLPVECLPLPERVSRPAWFPGDLPLPSDAYVSLVPESLAEGVDHIVFTVRGSLDDFVKFVLAEWEEAGWILGRGEREPGEAESVFYTKGTERYGQFRARAVYCDDAYTEVLLTLVLDPSEIKTPGSSPSPTPSAS